MSANLGIPTMAVDAVDKEGTFNTAVGKLDAAITDTKTLTLLGGTATYNPVAQTFLEAVTIFLSPDGVDPPLGSQTKTINVPAVKKVFMVVNNTLATAHIVQGNTIVVAPNSALIIHATGAALYSSGIGELIATAGRALPTVRYIFSSNVNIATLNNGDVISGDSVSTNDLVALLGQTTSSENGIYLVGATEGSTARSSLLPSGSLLSQGALILAKEGENGGEIFVLDTAGISTVGSSTTAWSLVTDAGPMGVGFFLPGTPASSSLLWSMVFDRPAMLRDEMLGSVGYVGTNPSSVTVLDVKKNGTTFGTISISTGGVFTFATTAGTNETFAIGDRLDVVSQSSLNGLADVRTTFKMRKT